MQPSKRHIKHLQNAEKELLKLSNALQQDYFNRVWREISPRFSASNSIQLLSTQDVYFKAWQTTVASKINSFLNTELLNAYDYQEKYYSQFTPPTLDFKQIKKIVKDDLIRKISLFAKQYTASQDVALRTRALAVGLAQSDFSLADIKQTFSLQLQGTAQKLGIVDNYNLVQLRIQDTFSEYDRTTSQQYATQLNLNYFIYNGGEIKTTRDFCDQRNGNVYTREEGIAFNSLDWQGKKEGHNFLVDAGGYNCRHYLDWISYELAKQLRPDIEKSKFDYV